MGKIVTVAIHKGGTGKTTNALHLAWAAVDQGLSVLFVDMDPQANASQSLGVAPSDDHEVASRLFANVSPAALHPVSERLFVIPADERLLAVERMEIAAAGIFRARLRKLAEGFDIVVVDTPPSMGFGMLAPLIASDYAYSPIVPDAYGVKGVSSLFARITAIQKGQNPALKYLGLLPNRLRQTDREQVAVLAEMQKKLGKSVIPFTVAERSAIAAAAHRGHPVWEKPSGGAARVAAKEMRAATLHILKKIGLEAVA